MLVCSGGYHPAYEAVCDVLERRLDAERVVLPGAGHGVQFARGFNDAFAVVPPAGGGAVILDIPLPIETERFSIRPLSEDDAEAVHEIWSDPEVMRYIPSAPSVSLEESEPAWPVTSPARRGCRR